MWNLSPIRPTPNLTDLSFVCVVAVASDAAEDSKKRKVLIRFNGDVAGKIPWDFYPAQQELLVLLFC